ncbi:MAG: uroporphyrinogen-III synthase [Oligoflexus sp.]|jgi:uroporphyrinogen-III synthase
MKKIIWTRPDHDWQQDQKLLKPAQLVHHFPVTRQVAISPQLPTKVCEFVIVTSRKAADAFLSKPCLSKDQMSKVEFLTFGLETYKFLASQNLKARLMTANGGKEFAEMLVHELKKGTVIWFPKPKDTAFPISEHLRAHQLEVHDIELYRTEAIKTIPPAQLQQLFAESAVVCFANPNAVKAFVEIVRYHGEACFYKFTPVAIGPTTMNSCQAYFKEFYVANQATLSALWEKALEVARLESPPEKVIERFRS